MMTLGFLPPTSDMTDRQPSRDMRKKECDKLKLKREILSGKLLGKLYYKKQKQPASKEQLSAV